MTNPNNCACAPDVRRLGRLVDGNWWIKRCAGWFDRREARRIYASLGSLESGGGQDFSDEIKRRLSRILDYAGSRCPYYRDLFRSSGLDARTLEGFDRLPLLDRATVKARMKDLLPDCIDRVEYTRKCTGGSTSQPLEFPLARAAQYVDHVHYEFTYRRLGWKPGEPIASFAGPIVSEEDRRKNIYWREVPDGRDLPYGRVFYSQLYLDDSTAEYYLAHISNLKPTILRGYPSLIDRLAEYFIARGTEPHFRVKGIQLNSEVTYDWQIDNIRRVFQAPIAFQYGQSEAGVFAYTEPDCREYRCSPFFGLAEVLDPQGRHVAIDETGEIVVTGFHNYALPFIRYRTGDLAVYGGSENGVVRIASIEGRQQDYLQTSDGKKVMLTGLVNVRAFCRVRRWQIVQNEPDKVRVNIVKDEGFSDADALDIINAFRDLYGVDAEISYVDQIPLTRSGKLRLLVQNVDS